MAVKDTDASKALAVAAEHAALAPPPPQQQQQQEQEQEQEQEQVDAEVASSMRLTSPSTDGKAAPKPYNSDTKGAEGGETTDTVDKSVAAAAITAARADAGESSDDAGSYNEDSDWKTSSSSESRPSSSARFSIVALPGRVRASIFPRRLPSSRRKKKPTRRSAPSGKPSAASLSPMYRQPSLPSLTPFAAFRRRQPPEPDSVEKFKHFWDEKLRHAMECIAANLAKPDAGFDPRGDVFHLLLKLYAHQDVIEDLYCSYEANADEFEFYIPQLCTFLVHGSYAKQHQLECFVMSRSGDSLTFAHRLTWFLRSFCDDARQYQSEYLSVTASPDQENSDLLTAIELRAGVPALLMNNGLCVEEVSASRPANLQRRRSIVFPIDQELDPTAMASDESFAGHLLTKRQSVVYEARTEEGNSQQISLYKQTPDFVDALTGLADRLIPVPRPQRNEELRDGLREIQDKLLPSDVLYLPIGNSYHRVKAIHADECFTFSTKERVPYFLCVEVLDYAVSSSESTKKSKQPRGFSLKLPFNKKSAGVDAAGNDSVDTSPAAGYKDIEDDSVVLLTPKGPRVTLAQIMEDEQLRASLCQGGNECRDSIDVSSDPLVDASPVAAYLVEPLDGEVGDDEKEDEQELEKPKAALFEDESAAEEEVLQKSTDEQLERMGQWSQPRARRDSKTQTSSASARSGGQFDTFYSSWFSRKTRRKQPETPVPAVKDTATEVAAAEQAGEATSTATSASAGADTLEHVEEVVKPPDVGEVNTSFEADPTASEEAGKPTPASGGTFMSWLPWRKAGNPSAAHDVTSTSSSDVVDQEVNADPSVEETSVEVFSASSIDLVDGYCGSPVVVTANDIIPVPVEGEGVDDASMDSGATEESLRPTATESAGVFGWLFRKNKAVTASAPDGASPMKNGDHDAKNQQEHEGGDTSSEHDEEAQTTASDATEHSTVRSESDPIEGEQPVVEPASENPETPDEQADSTDAKAEEEDGHVKDAPASGLSKSPADSSKSLFWFARRSKPGAAEAPKPVDSSTSGSSDPQSTEDASTETGDEATSCAPTEDASAVEPAVDAAESSQDESKPLKCQRSRDLSLSLDFMDPEAWKQNFDLEDGLSDAYLTEEDESAAAGVENEDEDYEPDVPEHLERLEEDEKPMIVFRERWSEKEARLRQESPFGDHPGWRLLSVIVKSNDDLRQEQFAAQLIAQCDRIFREYALPLKLRPYNVIATSATTGLIEAVPDTVSLDSLKRNDPEYTTLLDFYYRLHGPKDSVSFSRARRNFVESLAAYSIVCYVFQIKDRHNGNILLDTDGHVIHIDFGFLLTNSPGSNLNFERAPFKLTDEFVELMGGPRSSTFRYFRSLCIRAYLALRRDMEKIVLLVEMMLVGNAGLPCFAGGKKAVVDGLRARLKPGARTSTCQLFVNQLIDQSINNWRTRWYDKYQRACLGIR